MGENNFKVHRIDHFAEGLRCGRSIVSERCGEATDSSTLRNAWGQCSVSLRLASEWQERGAMTAKKPWTFAAAALCLWPTVSSALDFNPQKDLKRPFGELAAGAGKIVCGKEHGKECARAAREGTYRILELPPPGRPAQAAPGQQPLVTQQATPSSQPTTKIAAVSGDDEIEFGPSDEQPSVNPKRQRAVQPVYYPSVTFDAWGNGCSTPNGRQQLDAPKVVGTPCAVVEFGQGGRPKAVPGQVVQ